MIDRLLGKLETSRTHPTFLVGLLALVFVLTAVVAWRASEADQARVNMANRAIEEATKVLLGDWARYYEIYVANMLEASGPLIADPARSAEWLHEKLAVSDICSLCKTTDGIRSVFTVDPASGAARFAGPPLPSTVTAVIHDHITSGRIAPIHDKFHAGLYYVDVLGSVTTVLAYVPQTAADSPGRITGVVLSDAMSTELIEFTFGNARTFQEGLATGPSSDVVFDRSAKVGNVELLAPIDREGLSSIAVGDPIYGLTLALRTRSSATALLDAGGNRIAERTTLFVLMVAISALLITALQQVRRDAEMTRLRADFVSGVSHELRTPLAQIRMFTETLLLGRVRSDVERRRSLEIIDQEARRLAYLVENVLLFSKTEGGRESRVALEPTPFADEIRHAVESLSLLCRNRSAEVRTELQENITVPVDRMALRQILVNLVDNALKYGPPGQRITVGAALFDDEARVWVDDEGPGIPVEDRTRVFDSFYRLPRETESRVSGSGIGLAVVRELARLHGGNAWAEAAPGSGARIVVQFPDAYLRSEETGDLAAAS